MSTPSTTLAKLTRPRLYDALARERLFRLIDEHSRHPVVWIAAPPEDNIHLIGPRPLLMVVAEDERLTPTDLALEAYERTREP